MQGAAVAIASGYHLATKKFPIVYMQNSGEDLLPRPTACVRTDCSTRSCLRTRTGFGNAINPLVSLADSRVYRCALLPVAFPLLLRGVAWRRWPLTRTSVCA